MGCFLLLEVGFKLSCVFIFLEYYYCQKSTESQTGMSRRKAICPPNLVHKVTTSSSWPTNFWSTPVPPVLTSEPGRFDTWQYGLRMATGRSQWSKGSKQTKMYRLISKSKASLWETMLLFLVLSPTSSGCTNDPPDLTLIE
jgi:hypothetical protein